MRLITPEIEENILLQERNKSDVLKARKVLEDALCYQFRTLALGLFSYEILRGKAIDDIEFKILNDICIALYPNEIEIISSQGLRNYIVNGILKKRWPIIKLSNLNDLEIRIYNRYVYILNDIEINEQLSILGSNFRFYFAGAEQLTLSYIKKIINYNDASGLIDGRFIFGEVGNISVTYWGPIYDYIKEYAISPYFDKNAPGFSIGDTAVIRRELITGMKKSLANGEIDINWLHIYLHEIGHASAYSFKDKLPFAKANWKICAERDICRYLLIKHSYSEIKETFRLNFEDPRVDYLKENSNLDMSIIDEFEKLDDILESLIRQGKIIIVQDGCYECSIFKKGIRWDVL